MKLLLPLLLFAIVAFSPFEESDFTEQEKKSANTAESVTYMNEKEKQVIYFLNLCRINPQKFLNKYIDGSDYVLLYKAELEKKPQYYSSLKSALKKLKPLSVMNPDKKMYEEAACLAKEQAKSGQIGHKRKRCKESYTAENCTYGNHEALDIVIAMLIDLDVPSYGHRKTMLEKYTLVGVSIQDHKKFGICAVMDFK